MSDVAPAAEPRRSPAASKVAHAWLTTEVYSALEQAAARRRMHPDELTAHLLNVVATEQLWAQLLGPV